MLREIPGPLMLPHLPTLAGYMGTLPLASGQGYCGLGRPPRALPSPLLLLLDSSWGGRSVSRAKWTPLPPQPLVGVCFATPSWWGALPQMLSPSPPCCALASEMAEFQDFRILGAGAGG